MSRRFGRRRIRIQAELVGLHGLPQDADLYTLPDLVDAVLQNIAGRVLRIVATDPDVAAVVEIERRVGRVAEGPDGLVCEVPFPVVAGKVKLVHVTNRSGDGRPCSYPPFLGGPTRWR
jgi:hypothetical protein